MVRMTSFSTIRPCMIVAPGAYDDATSGFRVLCVYNVCIYIYIRRLLLYSLMYLVLHHFEFCPFFGF